MPSMAKPDPERDSTSGFPLHHVGIVCPTQRHVAAITDRLGLRETGRGFVPEYDATCIFTATIDGTTIELVVPSGGPLTEFNRGFGGLHHLAFVVPSLAELAAELAGHGVELLERQPVRGAGAFICNFLRPVHAGGIVVEYVELLPAS